MKVHELLTLAAKGDAVAAGRAADTLRLRGRTYAEIARVAERHAGIDPRDWEVLMQEADAEASRS